MEQPDTNNNAAAPGNAAAPPDPGNAAANNPPAVPVAPPSPPPSPLISGRRINAISKVKTLDTKDVYRNRSSHILDYNTGIFQQESLLTFGTQHPKSIYCRPFRPSQQNPQPPLTREQLQCQQEDPVAFDNVHGSRDGACQSLKFTRFIAIDPGHNNVLSCGELTDVHLFPASDDVQNRPIIHAPNGDEIRYKCIWKPIYDLKKGDFYEKIGNRTHRRFLRRKKNITFRRNQLALQQQFHAIPPGHLNRHEPSFYNVSLKDTDATLRHRAKYPNTQNTFVINAPHGTGPIS